MPSHSEGSPLPALSPVRQPTELHEEQEAPTAGSAVHVFSVAIIAAVPYSIAASKLRRPFLSDFFIVVRLRYGWWSALPASLGEGEDPINVMITFLDDPYG